MHLDTPARGRNSLWISVLCALPAIALAAGCEQLESRRQIQRGNDHYEEGRYQKAVEEYEPALQRTPDLAIGHHNAGLAYFKLFEPGNETPANLANAEKAAEHLQTYLEEHPDDAKIVTLLSQIWMDSGHYEKAVAYWEAELAKDPTSRLTMIKLANINRQGGDFAKALEWHYKRAGLETTTEGKVNAYVDIAQLEWSRLNKADLVDEERLAAADNGIAALQKAEALDPKHALVQSLLGAMYQHRAYAHGASWAKLIEGTAQRQHQIKFVELDKAAKAAQPAAPAQPNASAPK
jgi:tetratricopeptide (TPR) repeat protein